MSRSDLNISRWLEAHSDRGAGLRTLPNNVALADVAGDGDHRLVLGDIKLEPDTRSRMKVYKGTLLTADQTVPEIPAAVVAFYADNLEPRVPAVGVACGSDLLVYKNNKPFFKFTVPSLAVLPLEEDVWRRLSEGKNYDVHRLIGDLKQLPNQALSASDLNISRWLEAHSDRGAGLRTLPNNVALADVAGDGDHRLVLGDIKLEPDTRSRMKVYKGTLLTADQTVPEIPAAVVAFYADNLEPRVPAVGVACGSDLLVYKNNKPFFKFTVPSLAVLPLEEDVWRRLSEGKNYDVHRLIGDLKQLPNQALSARSQHLLILKQEEYADYINKYKDRELKRHSPITSVTTLNRSSPEWNAVACPVVATESGQIYILDPQNFSILHEAPVCSSKATPCIIKAVGLFDVEFRIVICTREGHVCLLRRGWLEGKSLLQTTSYIVDMAIIPGDNFVVLGTTDKLLSCYTKKGSKLWSSEMKNPITCMCLIPLQHLSTSLLAIGMKGGAIQIYQGRQLVDHVSAPDTPSALAFGQMGQEEHVLITVTTSGILDFKILKRTADFNLSQHENTTTPALHNKPLPLPKRSKLFLEQSARERQNAIEMHQHFQQDLIRLRLHSARAMVQSISDQSGIGNEKEMVKLSAQVLGLGPKFTLILSLENMNTDKALLDLSIVFHCKPTVYKLSAYFIQVPLVPPGLTYKAETKVEEVAYEDDKTLQGVVAANTQNIKVFCMRKNQSQPILAATINMPPTDVTIPLM